MHGGAVHLPRRSFGSWIAGTDNRDIVLSSYSLPEESAEEALGNNCELFGVGGRNCAISKSIPQETESEGNLMYLLSMVTSDGGDKAKTDTVTKESKSSSSSSKTDVLFIVSILLAILAIAVAAWLSTVQVSE